LILLQFPAGVLVEGLQVEWILGGDIFTVKQGADMTAKVLLVLHNFVQGDLVLDE
jgi:hypothetical protein